MALTEPTTEQLQQLFADIHDLYPASNLGSDQWYILLISALVTGGHTKHAGTIYSHLIAQPDCQTPDARKALVRRLREALFKLSSVVGVPKPMEAIFAIAAVERGEDKDYTFTREQWKSGEESQARGRAWLSQLYQANHAAIQDRFSAHQDFDWQSIEITYGLYLSDHSILGPVETELVVLGGIMMQNLRPATGWHLRGMRRIGMSSADLERIHQCIQRIAAFCGVRLTKVPNVSDIEHEV